MKPSIYIAGKISKNDFRHQFVPGLRGHDAASGPLDCGSFTYIGPFFESCDHGCRHNFSNHGVLGSGCEPIHPELTRRNVWERNTRAIRTATAFFAYIETGDACGSLVEIGMAQLLGLPRLIIIKPGAPKEDLWYATQGSSRIRQADDLRKAFDAFVKEASR